MKYINKVNEWSDCLGLIAYHINTSMRHSTNASPFQLIFLRNPNFTLNRMTIAPIELIDRKVGFYDLMNKAQMIKDVYDEIHCRERMVENRKLKPKQKEFKENDKILIRKVTEQKLDSDYKEPFKVTKVRNSKVEYFQNEKTSRKLVAHKSNLKKI
uniref:Uncharacterized protein n=1 Tax=Rhabditophanes sp. KR3021 TaxID=114890 RepID=A0AC35UIM9_9BILA